MLINSDSIQRTTYARPAAVKSPELTPIVVTPEITEKWNAEIMEGKRKGYVLIAYNEKDYLNMSQWLQQMLGYVKAQNETIKAYEYEVKTYNESLKRGID